LASFEAAIARIKKVRDSADLDSINLRNYRDEEEDRGGQGQKQFKASGFWLW